MSSDSLVKVLSALLAITFLAYGTPALAAKWIMHRAYASEVEGFCVREHIDLDRIFRLENGLISFPTKDEFHSCKGINAIEEETNADFGATKVFVVDCIERKMAITSLRSFSFGITMKEENIPRTNWQFFEAQSGTVGGKKLDFVCDYMAGKTSSGQNTQAAPQQNKPQVSNPAAPPRSKSTGFSIPLRFRGGVYEVMATLNSEVKVFFVVDSGASDVTIPASVATLLRDNGSLTDADFLSTKTYKFANGATGTGKVVRLRTLDLGGHLLTDVRAVVLSGDNVPVLLGQSALRRLGGWSINTKAQKLEVSP